MVAESPPLRRSRTTRWRAAVLIGVHVVAALHIAHWLATGATVTPVEPSEAMELGRSGVVNAGAVFFAVTILGTAIFGRFFCGWGCHLVALQDLCRSLLERAGIRPRPLGSRLLAWVPAAAFFYMFLWPLTYRLLAGLGLPELTFHFETSEFWATFPGWAVAIATFLVCGFVCVYLLGAKGFCSYACPYGAIFGLADRVAPGRIVVSDACQGCGHCTAVCTSNVRVHEEVRAYGQVVDPGCMKCMDCVSVCPNDALSFGWATPSLVVRPRAGVPPRRAALTWRQELLAGAAFAVSFLSLRGLYGIFPFLFSLGLGACLAYVVLLTGRLLAEPHVAFRRVRLKARGRLLPAGQLALAATALLAAGVLHSAAVQVNLRVGEWRYARTLDLQRALLAREGAPVLALPERQRVEAARSWLDRARRWGALPQPQLELPLARLAWLAGDAGALEERARAAVAARVDAADALRLLARGAAERGDLARAAAAWEAVIALEPAAPGGYLALGLALGRAGDLGGAARAFERGRIAAGDSVDFAYNAGLVAAYAGDFTGAEAGFRRALALEPDHLPARENLAGTLAALGRFDEAAAEFRAALERAPDDAETRLLLARALAGAGRLEEARREVEAALALAPGSSRAAELLEELTRSAGR